MTNTLCSLIIPISGDISNLEPLKETLKNASAFESEVEVILLFDQKKSELSAENQEEISRWNNANLKIHSAAFSSVGAARNFGLSVADSKWVAFTDADDVNDVRNFISMIREAEIKKSDIAIGKFRSNPDIAETRDLDPESLWDSETFQIPFGLNPGIWRCGFRLASIDGIRFPNLNMAEDQVFISRFFAVQRKIYFSNLVVYQYYVGREESLTNKVEQVRRISEAIPLSLELVQETESPYSNLLETLLISQILSGIKYGKIETRIAHVGEILIFLTSSGLLSILRRFHILIKVVQR